MTGMETLTDTEFLERLRSMRWPNGVLCPRCGRARPRLHTAPGVDGRRKYLCSGCGRTFTDLTGTVFARTRLPLKAWFLCGRRMLHEDPTCEELARHLKIKVATAWRLRRLLRTAMLRSEFRRLFEENGA